MRIGAPLTATRRADLPGSRTSMTAAGASTTGISNTRVPVSGSASSGAVTGETVASTSTSPT